jgi:hypothetical protein
MYYQFLISNLILIWRSNGCLSFLPSIRLLPHRAWAIWNRNYWITIAPFFVLVGEMGKLWFDSLWRTRRVTLNSQLSSMLCLYLGPQRENCGILDRGSSSQHREHMYLYIAHCIPNLVSLLLLRLTTPPLLTAGGHLERYMRYSMLRHTDGRVTFSLKIFKGGILLIIESGALFTVSMVRKRSKLPFSPR